MKDERKSTALTHVVCLLLCVLMAWLHAAAQEPWQKWAEKGVWPESPKAATIREVTSPQVLSYVYDENSDGGAMLGSVRYNTLGLPTMMSIATSSPEKAPRKERVYDATGCKLRQRETEYPGGVATLTEDHRYVGLFTFSADSLERMDFDGGYFDSAGKAHFLFTDWQGNVTLDVDADGAIDQHISYYPYGEPWREPKGQRQTLFAAKERQRGQLAGTYDFGPRAFNPVFLSWDSADRYADKYAGTSPWIYCGSNPIRNIDPSGDDYYVFDQESGILIEHTIDDEDDIIAVTNQKDFYVENNPIPKGSIISFENRSFENNDFLFIKMRGDDYASKLFEFLAENINVEFSQAMCGEAGDNGLNFITTSFQYKMETGMGCLIKSELQYGYKVREHNHSHATGRAKISKSDSILVSKLNNTQTLRSISYNLFIIPAGESRGVYLPYNQATRTNEDLLQSIR